MDKNAIKKYAVWARRELISRVSQKALQYGITDKAVVSADATSVNGVVLSAEEKKQRQALIEQIKAKGYEQVMEEVAYTWFNRFIALRFMEVNGYLPSHVRVFTDEDNNFKPQILAEAISLEMDGLDMEKVYALKDANDDEGLFKCLIIVQCNALNPILPRMFQRISDYTELLFPDNLLREGSAIEQMIAMIPEEDWKDAVQIIGWLYQYYNSEKKDEVFAALKKNVKITKENIPAATQLFTPDWIVRYMVENSLGRLWVEGHPNDELIAGWKYYLDEAEQDPEVQAKLNVIRKEYASIAPEQIKCIDPCAGSGHILAYMFDVLVQIYEAYGYTAREAVRSIIENNIYGLDIDDRAAQLAYFAVMMKARQYDRRFLTRKDENGSPDVPQPHVYAIVESNKIDTNVRDYFVNGNPKLKTALDSVIKEMHDAKEYGSILSVTPVDFDAMYARFGEIRDEISMYGDMVLNDLLPLVHAAEILAESFDVVVTNPPYMGSGGMSSKLADFLKSYYPSGKADFAAAFIQRCIKMTKPLRRCALVTPQSWMFLIAFYQLRKEILAASNISSLIHLGTSAFDSGFGTAAFVLDRIDILDANGVYFDLRPGEDSFEKQGILFDNKNRLINQSNAFTKLPNCVIAYWCSQAMQNVYGKSAQVRDHFSLECGIKNGNNDLFLRFWHEVPYTNLNVSDERKTCLSNMESGKKWFKCNKGGGYRKWYGNYEYVINLENNARDIKATILASTYRLRKQENYFWPTITWPLVSGTKFGCRYMPTDTLPDVNANIILLKGAREYCLMGYMNSKVFSVVLDMLNPSLAFPIDTISSAPFKPFTDDKVEEIVKDCICLSREDWSSLETSWDFRKHPLVPTLSEWDEQRNSQFSNTRAEKFSQLAWHYDQWVHECQHRFDSLKANEEELNRIFIDIYGLQDELTPDVEDKDITVRLADKKRDIKSLISYAVGCMFGRYSLDVPGLAYAGGEWDDSKYVTFKADKDSIIPICDDEYFSDDIVNRFIRFIEVVYGKDTLQDNLCFIADALGGSGQPKDIIRKYFMDEFYADHLKTYQKRPIYWLFDSGKKGGFRALVYMHRYQPDTIARMRTDYVHEQQSRYRTAIADLGQRIASASTSERVKLNKRLATLQEQAAEIQGYEEKIHHLADQYISIDLDDGVKVNYEKFLDVLAKIK